MSILKKAEHTMAYAKIGIMGFQGTGKTYTSALIAIGICNLTKNNKIAFFDSETGSDFMISMMREHGIEMYQVKSRAFKDLTQTIQEGEKDGFGVLIIDSITHVWKELCQSYDEKLKRHGRLQFQDWNLIKPTWQRDYVDLFLNSKIHIIVCGRAGYEYDYDFNEDGTKDLIKTGTRMKAESEFGFEPSLVIEMERVSENREEVETIKKDKQRKQTFRPKVGSQWIHRAHVLKDRSDTLDGKSFDDPTFDDFLPHFQTLNIGGQHLGVDISRTSKELFDAEGKPTWAKEKEMAKIALEEIEGELVKFFPGQGAKEKRAKVELVETIFQTKSWTKVEGLQLEVLRNGLNRIRVILTQAQNIRILLGEETGKLIEPVKKDVPDFDLEKGTVICPESGASPGKEKDNAECKACPDFDGCPAYQ